MTQPHTHYPHFPFQHSDAISTCHMPLYAYQPSVCIPTCILLISPKYLPYLCISNIPSHWSFLSRPPFLLFSSSSSSTYIPTTQLLVIWLLPTPFRLIVLLSLHSYWLTIFQLHRYIPLFP